MFKLEVWNRFCFSGETQREHYLNFTSQFHLDVQRTLINLKLQSSARCSCPIRGSSRKSLPHHTLIHPHTHTTSAAPWCICDYKPDDHQRAVCPIWHRFTSCMRLQAPFQIWPAFIQKAQLSAVLSGGHRAASKFKICLIKKKNTRHNTRCGSHVSAGTLDFSDIRPILFSINRFNII